MNVIKTNSGLSARQETSYSNRLTSITQRFIARTIFLTLLTIVALAATSCKQDTKAADTAALDKDNPAVADTTKQPKVNIKVNRRFDDKGNLLAFDSTYSTYYSYIGADTLRMDSLMKSFDTWFGRNHSTLFDRQFNSLFFDDTLRHHDFFHNDFFMKRYELNDRYLRDMMHRMDSLKNEFYEEHRKTPASRKDA